MWTKEKLEKILSESGHPFAFLFFDSPQSTPYIIITMDDSRNVLSDLRFHQQIDTFSLEFYYRDPEDRFSFERWLTENGFLWQRVSTDNDIGQDGVYVSYYEI